ncbi:MAG: endonuclease/exonuclease/phosphatase family protein [Myxococcales bacterium]|nr:endonuclease/exonuclease/phosphatase family protein [Myxococcales bacterium]
MSRSLSLITWNVLHRIHAENWNEPAIAAYPEEDARVVALTARIVAAVPAVDLQLLQEVSGDLLTRLRAQLVPPACVLAMRYPRVPRPRQASSVLADPAEYLVVVSAGPATVVHQIVFSDDRGKGFLAVEHQGVRFVCAHLTYGEDHPGQWEELAACARSWQQPVVLGGDFNADRATVAARLGGGFTIGAPAPGGRATRPRAAPSEKSLEIDHVVVRAATIDHVEVLDGSGLSDHNPVLARLRAE